MSIHWPTKPLPRTRDIVRPRSAWMAFLLRALGPVPKSAPMPEHSTFGAWKLAVDALATRPSDPVPPEPRGPHPVREDGPIGEPELREAFDALHAAIDYLYPGSRQRIQMSNAIWTLRRFCAARVPPDNSGAAVPDVLFCGRDVYAALSAEAQRRTGPENVSDVLDAVVKILRATTEGAGTETEGGSNG